MYNPRGLGWSTTDPEVTTHYARSWGEEAVSWGPQIANMYKIWFDRSDSWHSLIDNVHQQVGMQWFQSSGAFINTDMMTAGRGGMTAGETRAELALYAALGAPMLLCCDLRHLAHDNVTLALVTNAELIAANQDADCTMGTRLSPTSRRVADERWAGELWIRPLSDGSFLVALVNADPSQPRTLSVAWSGEGDLFPAGPFTKARVRDIFARVDLGEFTDSWSAQIPPHDARLLRLYLSA